MALKGLVELCEDENQFLQCLEGTGRFEKLLKAVIQTINMIDEAAIGISYHLQLESVQLIIMVSKKKNPTINLCTTGYLIANLKK